MSERLNEQDVTQIVARACMGASLEPLGRGNNDGRIKAKGYDHVIVDCFGHEGNAEFLSHAQSDVLRLVDEVRALRADLANSEARAERLRAALREIVLGGATLGQEPTRIAYDEPRPKGYPLRDAFVFCGRITDHGHADDCPWQVARVALAPPTEPDAGGERR
jgi:hypothetical protein